MFCMFMVVDIQVCLPLVSNLKLSYKIIVHALTHKSPDCFMAQTCRLDYWGLVRED